MRSDSRLMLVLALLCVRLGTLCAEEAPPVPVQVFYSAKDARWKETEKALDAVVREFPRVQLEKISIDTDKGYADLTDAERSHHIEETGDITLIFGPYYLTSKGERRSIETFFGPMTRRILKPKDAKGRLKYDCAAYAAEIFGKDVKIENSSALIEAEKDTHLDAVWHAVTSGGKRVGWVVDAYWPIACPVCNDTQFVVALSSLEQKVVDLRPVRELERLGKPMDAKESQAFTTQFKNLTPGKSPPKIDAISGATKTTNSYQGAMAKILSDLKKREAK